MAQKKYMESGIDMGFDVDAFLDSLTNIGNVSAPPQNNSFSTGAGNVTTPIIPDIASFQLSDLGQSPYGADLPSSQNNSLGLNGADGLNLNVNSTGLDLAGLGAAGQGIAGLASAWAGLQGIKLGKEQLKFQKESTNRNLANQAQTVNTSLADRQARRVDASGGGAYQSVAEYMKNNSVNGGAL